MEALNEGESTSRGTGIIISTLLAIDLCVRVGGEGRGGKKGVRKSYYLQQFKTQDHKIIYLLLN